MRGGRGPSPVETHGQQSAPRPSLAYPPLNPHRTAHRGAGTPGTRGVGWGGGGRLLGFLLGVNRPCVTLQNRPPPPFFATPPNFVSLPRIEKVLLKLRPSGNFAKKPRILQKSLVFCKALAAPRQVSGRGGGGARLAACPRSRHAWVGAASSSRCLGRRQPRRQAARIYSAGRMELSVGCRGVSGDGTPASHGGLLCLSGVFGAG